MHYNVPFLFKGLSNPPPLPGHVSRCPSRYLRHDMFCTGELTHPATCITRAGRSNDPKNRPKPNATRRRRVRAIFGLRTNG